MRTCALLGCLLVATAGQRAALDERYGAGTVRVTPGLRAELR